jgi:nitroreductase
MNVYDAIMKRRTIRKFEQKEVKKDDLEKLVDCARVAATGANQQPLKFAVITNKDMLKKIYPLTKWAGALADGAPKENERPAAYIAVLGDTAIRPNGAFEVEAGAAVTTMMLEAVEMGLASCWLGAIARDEIKKLLGINENLNVLYLLAVGYPMQKSRMTDLENRNVKYFESEDGTINVPKRALGDVLTWL